jgi:phage gp36-like protein
MFLTKAELKTVSTVQNIDLIVNNDETIVETIIQECVDVMHTYLFKYYDADAIFAKEGQERSRIIIKYLKDLSIYEIYMRRSKQANAVVEKRQEEAMIWLEKVAKGEIVPDLPKKMIDTDGDGEVDAATPFMKLGSRKSYKNHF